jgi:hypothetical protein
VTVPVSWYNRAGDLRYKEGALVQERITSLLEGPLGRLSLLQASVLSRLGVPALQAFKRDLDAFDQARPLVIALLAWVGWRAYRAERRRLKRP